jgi:membrane-associated phospholipid phosphatase
LLASLGHGRLRPVSRLHLGLGLVSALMALAQPAAADSADSVNAEAASGEPRRVVWNDAWPRFRRSEAVVTGIMLLPIAGALFVYPEPNDNIHGGFLFDNAIRDAVVLHSRSARARAATLSNVPYLNALAFPLLVDTALVTAGIHGAGDVALEMLAINLHSYAISGAISLTFQKLGRVRPSEKGCRLDPNYAAKCDNPVALNQSFLSGHTAIAFTGAGLTCVHHRHLPLYGGGWPDVAICVAMLAAGSTTAALRVMSDNHYASDALLGIGVGLVTGWGLPEWLHYGAGDGEGHRSGLLPTFAGGGWTALVAPQIGEGAFGLTLIARH